MEVPKTVPASAWVGMRARVTRGDGSLIMKSRRGLNSPSPYDPIQAFLTPAIRLLMRRL